MFIDWLPEVLRPWRSSKMRAKRGIQGGWSALDPVASNVEHLEPLQMLSAAPIDSIARNDFITSNSGHLTGPSSNTPAIIGQDYLSQNYAALGLTAGDVAHLKVTSQSVSTLSGATSIYYQQTYNGIAVQGSVANITIAADGSVVSVGNRLIPNLTARVNAAPPVVTQATAVLLAGAYHGLTSSVPPDPYGSNTFQDASLSLDPIPVTQQYVVSSQGDVRLSWDVVLRSPTTPDWFDVSIDALTGAQTSFDNWTDYFQPSGQGGSGGSGGAVTQLASTTPTSQVGTGVYNVYPLPITSPDDGIRQTVANAADSFSSPFGWHDINGIAGADFTDTRGNNVYAQDDIDGNDTGGVRPDGGASLTFDFPIDLTVAPSGYTSAATVQLFYMTNVLHDIFARYGFDAASGNFQQNNYGQGGLGNDQVQADAQDSSTPNAATFSTPPDGQSPRMQIGTFTSTALGRDGDLDSELIIHEYAHGLVNRLTGGAANTGTLSALQSTAMDEGWGDFWSLMLTQRVGDTQNAAYYVGTYLTNNTASGPGMRDVPYSYDLVIDPLTYGNFSTNTEPHDAGQIWASALWDMSWLLNNKYGFNADMYTGTGGNNRALALVTEALKIQPANPSFLDGRDAILAADRLLYGGVDQSMIWEAFARRGMGFSASDGGSAQSAGVTAAFDVPAAQKGTLEFNQSNYALGDTVQITLKDIDLAGTGTQDVTVISSAGDQETVHLTEVRNGGIFVGSIVSKNSESTGFTVDDGLLEVPRTSTISIAYLDANDGTGSSKLVTDSATFFVFDNVLDFDFSNPDGSATADGFTTSGALNLWHLSTGRGLDLGHSSDDSFYFGQGETTTGGGTYTPNANGTLTSPVIDLTNFTGPVFLEYNQFLDLEDVNDTATVSVIGPGGTIVVATNNGVSANMPDSTGGFQKMRIDLTAFAGQKIRLAFQVQANASDQREGWYVDDIHVSAPLGTLEGTIYNDSNGNGQLDLNESPLPGWTVFLDNNNNGVLDDAINTYTATGMPVAVPDQGQIVSNLTVSNVVGPISDLNVNLTINHTRDSDLDVYLISPAGTRIELFTDVGALGQNFINTTLDDQANFSINLGSSPFVGAFSPEGLLSALNGENANGVWKLEVKDDSLAETGSLVGWSITVTSPESSTVTDASGHYRLTATNGGTYNVREIPQPGWIQTFPSGATAQNPNPAQTVTVPFGTIVQGIDFYNQFVFPVVTLPGSAVTYTENEPPVTIEAGALLTDANSLNFGGGSLAVTLTANATTDDRLTIQNQGNGLLQIGVIGNTVYYQGSPIGTFGGGAGATPLIVNFNVNATPAAVRALMRAIQFEAVGENPSPLTRTVQFLVTDDTGGVSVPVTKQINVIPVNDAPVVTVSGGTLTYTENDPAKALDVFATVTDVDSPDFNNGYLQVSLVGNSGGPTTVTQKTFNATDLPLTLDNNTVQSHTIVSGVSGNLSDVNVTLNIAHTADPELTAYLVSPNGTRVKLFSNAGLDIIPGQDFTDTTFDDQAGISILSFSASAPFTGSYLPEKELSVLNGQNPNGDWALELTDAKGAVVDGTGTLISWSLQLTLNETSSNEKLGIVNQGSNVGEIGLVGNRVTYGGIVIGTYIGGVGTSPLVVNFNSNSTQEAVRSLMQNVTLQITGDSPIPGARQAIFVVNDGDGDSSIPATRFINVVAVNDAPTLSLPSGEVTYVEGAPPTVLDTIASVSDIDSTDFNNGVLTASLGATAQTGDVLGIRSSGQAIGQVSVSGSTVRYGSTPIGVLAGGMNGIPLTVTFNVNATPAAVQAVASALTFQSKGINPDTTPRLISVRVTDGDGGTSPFATKVVTVIRSNDPPVLTLSTSIVPPDTEPASQVKYNSNGLPVILDPLATVTDPDTAVFNNGRLTVSLVSGGSTRDRLNLQSQGPLVVISGSVFYNGIMVGRMTPGLTSTPLTVNFNSSASIQAVQAVVQAVNFQILGPNVVGGDRVVTFQVTDGTGGTSLTQSRKILVQINNEPPLNTVPADEIQAMEDTPVAITGLAVSDPDASLLPIQVTLSAQNGKITIDTSVINGVSSASVVGNGTNRVVITADQDSINATLQSLNGVLYQGVQDYHGSDQVTMLTSDLGNSGPGGVLTDQDLVFIDIQAMFDTATITTSAGIAKNIRGNEALLDSGIKSSVGDNQASLNAAILSINVTEGRNRSDRLRLMNEGKGEGQINVVAGKSGVNTLRLGTVKIGTISGGESGKPLKIVFNGTATAADLQHILRIVTFRTAVQTTVYGLRTVTYNFTDGLGLPSTPATKQINVVRS